MKHIKEYKLFESYPPNKFEIESERKYKELEPDVKDILLELNDSGVVSHTSKYIDDSIFEFQIEITSLKTKEQKQICEDSLLRLEDFLSEHGLHLAKIEMEQLITSEGRAQKSLKHHSFLEFDLYDMSELVNLKGAAGIISLIVYFSKS
jgi:hypothetical protein